jgi:hypothetical protein
LGNYKHYGFKDKSAMVRVALLQLQKEFEERVNIRGELASEDMEKIDRALKIVFALK